MVYRNSETAALHIALLAHNIGKEAEGITRSFTFIVTSNSIIYTEKSGGKRTWKEKS
ncbi:UDP-4-amino-4-deoxy-L-arabinose--oxoglutarate aminotransferase [Methanosarcina siciliae C2J]|uniref:UDP-4-amino-4-deoxy-L-arabinose--oxoglutarate aminotransferase n=2 Tax=Methanosarcina siciliae TaxID=38027 RepID=A0A0E3L887_9EURY|nr:DegT/DnrJ/EryC1/StrS family aminotransferase [Methanosarcina siciliae]AKB28091.1 UDP-4-amino-4-deoxy-L-arabinose--oxoglutarate aminotransferase [Methanosarcina siciliae T4/M]AKB36306.1 UDP-4-amino-4-deoxy-L-arabinose--oxoglutarate aminotransferase [Methanosarcina siciliae C2J]